MKQIFESENIRFIEVSEALTEDYLAMVNDMENVERYLGGAHEPFTAKDERRWVREKLAEKAPVFSMIEKKTGAFIGNIELMDVKDSVGELGIALTARMQDRGYGTEAVSALTAYAFERMGLERIVLRTDPANTRAIRVYEKCLFREGERRDGRVFMELSR